ncbi:hypothetical protein J7T55_015012 [Diaporthe amygdali]|uniref:uncharacterized protein n=1 Tax=Phomopsis amygdali TaxID=1214568 RepID=UPI0022FDBDFA|nr:uncharacterized protein J7T55_015012 [Diaporthe amygdali]KAJ0108578.1 hypothetical protein J7T55_015012 [Diaporthe amygdali]
MPSDSETATAKEEVPPAAAAPQSDAHSEEGEASEVESPEADIHNKSDSAQTPRESQPAPEHDDAPPLPDEPLPGSTDQQAHDAQDDGGAPPLPNEAPPEQVDDGWDAMWDASRQAWYFYNRFTGTSQWDNPRVQTETASTEPSSSGAAAPAPISQPSSIAGGYNPAIHGSWDPNAPYAQAYKQADAVDDDTTTQYTAGETALEGSAADPYAQAAAFNSRTGRFQAADLNPDNFSDAAKSQRQMNAYFDVDRAANSHDGRSLKAERRGKQPTKKELAQWKEKRKAKKEEKRRAWLRD